jgi:hypothetical protein
LWEDFVFQKTASNPVVRTTRTSTGRATRLNQGVHDAALGYVQAEKIGFVQTRSIDQPIVLKLQTVNGKILAERTTIDPAVGENEVVVGHEAGALEFFAGVQKHPWIDYARTALRDRLGRCRHLLA